MRVFFCTGARNQDLLKHFPAELVTFEYDERMAAFKALGLAKQSQSPVIVCTTSGTAVAECVPAMLEALYSEVPLVLITGDRPKKLHGTGSPQTVHHETLTAGCRGSYIEIDYKDFAEFKLVDPVYPVHVNVLVDDTVPHELQTVVHESNKLDEFLRNKKTPLFLFSHESDSMRPFIERFSTLGIPFYAETLSCGRDLSTIENERELLRLWNADFFDCVVRIGHTPLSKIWRLLEKKPMPVYSIDSRGLAGLSFGEVFRAGSREISVSFGPFALPAPESALPALIDKYPHSEVALMARVLDTFKTGATVYLGNSLIVRFFELVQNKKLKVFGSRGVNGIDGQLSTAIGIALGTRENVTCILGDITTLYDLSALREMPANLRLIIMNNGGGRIFDMLKLDKRIVMEHAHEFQGIAEGMGLRYSRDVSDQTAQVVELSPVQDQTNEFLKEWNA